MTAVSTESPPRPAVVEPQAEPGGSFVVAAYAATIFLSAFLLFQVQPLISKFILPWFGGSPAVWTAAMLFFQAVLFAGYLYAHLTSTFLKPRGQFLLHLALLAIASSVTLATRIIPSEAWKPAGGAEESPLLQVLMLLGATVGLPYFVVSSTGPLLQKWYGDAFEGASPYRLFALSNLGSLSALLSYPFFFEVRWDSHQQANLWSFGFALFAISCAFCAWWTYRARTALGITSTAQKISTSSRDVSPSFLRRAAWIFLPALASVMLLAVTNEVCQNVATVPLLWIIPLSLYLLSFIVAFDHPRWYSRSGYATATVLALIYLAGYDPIHDLLGIDPGWIWQCAVYFTAFFLVCMVCHCELAELRPTSRYLTSYYMTLSLGGAVGGTLVNLLAPYLFTTFFELPLAVFASLLVAATTLRYAVRTEYRDRIYVPVTPLLLGAILLVGWFSFVHDSSNRQHRTLYRERNFYGIVSVQHRWIDVPQDSNMAFFSGHVPHGKEWADPARRREPITYYGPGSGCEKAIRHAQRRPEVRIGVIGLGIGTIATYARENDVVRFYEINPEVVSIAKNSDWFHFLADCKGRYEIVLGDARSQLERELREHGSNEYDVLVLDAFSGDAIPTHLITDEAFAVYKQHLKPDGIIAAHITNTYLDLYPVVKMQAEKHGLRHTRIYFPIDDDRLLNRNYYLLATTDAAFIDATPEEITAMPENFRIERKIPLWTDRYSNLLQILRW